MDINEGLLRPDKLESDAYNEQETFLSSKEGFSRSTDKNTAGFSVASQRLNSSMSKEEIRANLVYERMRALGVAGRGAQKQSFAKIKELEIKKKKNDLYKK